MGSKLHIEAYWVTSLRQPLEQSVRRVLLTQR
jgi:hypothetical protein